MVNRTITRRTKHRCAHAPHQHANGREVLPFAVEEPYLCTVMLARALADGSEKSIR